VLRKRVMKMTGPERGVCLSGGNRVKTGLALSGGLRQGLLSEKLYKQIDQEKKRSVLVPRSGRTDVHAAQRRKHRRLSGEAKHRECGSAQGTQSPSAL